MYAHMHACLYVYDMYVCVYEGTQMSYIDNMPTIFVQACMYKQQQSNTQICEIQCYTAGENIPFGVLCKLLMVALDICKGYFLYVLVFKT